MGLINNPVSRKRVKVEDYDRELERLLERVLNDDEAQKAYAFRRILDKKGYTGRLNYSGYSPGQIIEFNSEIIK